jgi:hypothetical protein
MSSQSTVGLGVTIEAALQAIMTRLDAKLQPLQPMQDQVEALEKTVCAQGEQQCALQTTVEQVDATHWNQGTGRPQQQGLRRTGDNDAEDQGGDFLPTAHKLEFPMFDSLTEPPQK